MGSRLRVRYALFLALNHKDPSRADLHHARLEAAPQSGIPIPENVLLTAALASFSAFRVKSVLGWGSMASPCLNQALLATNQAVFLNPNQYQYHAFAGTTLLAMGNLSDA